MDDDRIGSATKTKALVRIGDILSNYGTLFILLFMVILMSILSPHFLTINNLLNVLRQISIICITALGITMVIISGGIDLSCGSIIGVVSVVTAVFAHPPDMLIEFLDGLNRLVNYPAVRVFPLIVPVGLGLLIGGLLGLINGVIIAYGKLPPFIATLGMMASARGLAMLISNAKPVGSFTIGYLFIGRGAIFGIPFPVILLFIFVLVAHYVMAKTSFGRHIYAIGGNLNAAKAAGLNIRRHILAVYSISGMMAGIGGLIITSRITSGQPGLGLGMEFDAITAAVVGGTSLAGGIGMMPGTLIGALIVGVLKNGLDLLGVSAYWQQILTGVIIVGAVLLDQRRHARRAIS
ncbi:MAG: ABC transporter permease [Actinobacteria bacterium]|nr:ABC transporter permease [Actinomycetota bacterium]